ncbi:MAG TPA: hypothetical protein PKM25_04295 [Candidatus Ozemobacteraceae bacterium]|nr:hypothetical protein [Candidatus Ozemobacteraceae bacterium]
MTDIEGLARAVVRRGWSAPVIFLIESWKPMAGIGAAGFDAALPLLKMIGGREELVRWRRVISDRDGLEKLAVEIERLEAAGGECDEN